MRATIIVLLIALGTSSAMAQFHTMKIPQASNKVEETQTLAVTDITINYSSPAVRNRDVWNDTDVIPQNAEPIAWRAGANMSTTFTFSTDVMIECRPLAAGTYGFHIIPKGDIYQLIFTDVYHQWGSYYLDLENDVTLSVDVSAETSDFSEKLDYEFINWSEGEVTVALEWADQRIPFKVSVDLNKTVIESFRSELRGINTYRWEAWNDAAMWCLNHNTNLEEALSWAERSINGGYNGFAANSNITNNSTRIQLLKKLGRTDETQVAITQAISLIESANDANYLSQLLIRIEDYGTSVDFLKKANKSYPDVWYLHLNLAVSQYLNGESTPALKSINKVLNMAPDNFKERLTQIKSEMENGTYRIPNS